MVICQYCNNPSRLVDGSFLYPHRSDLSHLNFYYCDDGHEPAYVGCHPHSTKTLGILANSELRDAKKRAHLAFDPIWRNKRYTRGQAYKWLAETMGLTREECHIGMFSIRQCTQVVLLSVGFRRQWEYPLQAKAEKAMIEFAKKLRK